MARFAERGDQALPVVDGDGGLIGVVNAVDIEHHTLAHASGASSARQLAHTPQRLRADDLLEQAIRALAVTDDPGLPVLAPDEQAVVGWVTHRDILRAYHSERERLSPAPGWVPAPGARGGTSPSPGVPPGGPGDKVDGSAAPRRARRFGRRSGR